MAPIRIGLIGLSTGSKVTSWAATAHLPYLQSEQGKALYEIVALCNSSVESAKKSVEKFELSNSVKTYGSPTDLANDPDIELVVCVVGVMNHYDVLLPAVQAGKNVYTELPLASNMKQMEELVDLADKKGIKTMFGSQGQAHPVIHLIKKLITDGKIGKVLSTSLIASSGISMIAGSPAFRMFAERKLAANLGTVWFIHSFTCLIEIFGELEAFSSIMGIDYPNFDLIDPEQGGKVIESVKKYAPDNILLQGRFQSGTLVTYQMRAGHPFPGEPGCRWVINGDKGSIQITSPHGTFDIAHSGIEIKLCEGSSKEAKTIELPTDHLSDMGHPAQNVGRLYEAFAKGETNSYADWKVALKRHQLVEEMFQRGDGSKPYGEPAAYAS